MDKIRIILAALAAGSAKSAGRASAERAHAYADLADQVRRAFGDNPKAVRALEDYAEDPDTYERPLAKALIDARIDRNDEIVAAAQALLQIDRPQPGSVLEEVAARERIRTSDRFTRRAESIVDVKAQDTAASQQRLERLWEQERERQADIAARQAKQKQQERQLITNVLIVAGVIFLILVFVAIALLAVRG